MMVIQMSDRELTRLRVMIDLADGRLTVEAAATLMNMGRRQVFRLRHAFEAGGTVLHGYYVYTSMAYNAGPRGRALKS